MAIAGAGISEFQSFFPNFACAASISQRFKTVK
jgi:hypothetical protein